MPTETNLTKDDQAAEEGRTVFLFSKYKGAFKTHVECQTFVDGVLAVLFP